MNLEQQKQAVARLASASAHRSDEIREHQCAIQAWKRERLASTGSLALFFAAGIIWGSSDRKSERSNGSPSAGRKAASVANTSLLLWRLFNDPVQSEP